MCQAVKKKKKKNHCNEAPHPADGDIGGYAQGRSWEYVFTTTYRSQHKLRQRCAWTFWLIMERATTLKVCGGVSTYKRLVFLPSGQQRLQLQLSESELYSRPPRLQTELLPAQPGGLLGKVHVPLWLLPHVVILHTLAHGASSYLRRRRSKCVTNREAVCRVSPSQRRRRYLISLNKVEVLPVNSVTLLKVSTFLFAPGTQLLWGGDAGRWLKNDLQLILRFIFCFQ